MTSELVSIPTIPATSVFCAEDAGRNLVTEKFMRIGLTRDVLGHVRTPWFSFAGVESINHNDAAACQTAYGKFQEIRAASINAFAFALGISADDVMVSERKNPIDGATEWILVTRDVCQLPKPKTVSAPKHLHLMPKKKEERYRPTLAEVRRKESQIENQIRSIRQYEEEAVQRNARIKELMDAETHLRADAIKVQNKADWLRSGLCNLVRRSSWSLFRWRSWRKDAVQAISEYDTIRAQINLTCSPTGFTGLTEEPGSHGYGQIDQHGAL